jgi:photosystem II stability/assembly factor-like uncharacterized protein
VTHSTDAGPSAQDGAFPAMGDAWSDGSPSEASASGASLPDTAQPDSPPQNVGACDNLAAPGQWEYIWPLHPSMPESASNPGDSTAIVLDPFNAGTIWAGANNEGIYKSSDCGATWTHINTGNNGAQLDSGGLVTMAVDPQVPNVLYVAPIYGAGGVWKSTNGGVDWDNLVPSSSSLGQAIQYNEFDSISMDPKDHNHLVVGTHANCNGPSYTQVCEAESTDGGATWTLVFLPFLQNWEEGGGPWVLDASSWLYSGSSGLWLTTDHGAQWKNVTPTGVNYFACGEVETHTIPRGPDGTYYLPSEEGLIASTDGHGWSQVPGCAGRMVAFAMGGGHLYIADQWSGSYWTASDTNPSCSTLSTLTQPSTLTPDGGAPYLAYDAAHHVLYSSDFAGGLWRIVTP